MVRRSYRVRVEKLEFPEKRCQKRLLRGDQRVLQVWALTYTRVVRQQTTMAKMEGGGGRTLPTFFYSGKNCLSSTTTPLQLHQSLQELKDSPCDLVVEDEYDLSSDDDTRNDEPIDIIANNLESEVVDESMIFMIGCSSRD